MNERDVKRSQLERDLATVNEHFEREMRARGFDPEQVDNIPFDNELTKLHLQRLELIEQIDEMEGR